MKEIQLRQTQSQQAQSHRKNLKSNEKNFIEKNKIRVSHSSKKVAERKNGSADKGHGDGVYIFSNNFKDKGDKGYVQIFNNKSNFKSLHQSKVSDGNYNGSYPQVLTDISVNFHQSRDTLDKKSQGRFESVTDMEKIDEFQNPNMHRDGDYVPSHESLRSFKSCSSKDNNEGIPNGGHNRQRNFVKDSVHKHIEQIDIDMTTRKKHFAIQDHFNQIDCLNSQNNK